jgi:ankyrin repeat protein
MGTSQSLPGAVEPVEGIVANTGSEITSPGAVKQCKGSFPVIEDDMIRFIKDIECVPDPNKYEHHGSDKIKNTPPLLYCAEYGWDRAIAALLQRGADVNAHDPKNVTALAIASNFGKYKCVKLLLEHGANVDATDSKGYGVLFRAVAFGRCYKCVRLLLEYGAKVETAISPSEGFSALLFASHQGNVCVASLLLKYGADVDVYDLRNVTALATASGAGKYKCVKLLLEHGASVDVRDNASITALHRASMNGHAVIVSLLLRYGADANAVGGNGPNDIAIVRAVSGNTLAKRGGPHWATIRVLLPHILDGTSLLTNLFEKRIELKDNKSSVLSILNAMVQCRVFISSDDGKLCGHKILEEFKIDKEVYSHIYQYFAQSKYRV